MLTGQSDGGSSSVKIPSSYKHLGLYWIDRNYDSSISGMCEINSSLFDEKENFWDGKLKKPVNTKKPIIAG